MSRTVIAKALITGSVLVGLFDRVTRGISTLFGKIRCGDRYIQPVDGVIGDMSCGFNDDMYLLVFLLVMFLAGIALYLKEKTAG